MFKVSLCSFFNKYEEKFTFHSNSGIQLKQLMTLRMPCLFFKFQDLFTDSRAFRPYSHNAEQAELLLLPSQLKKFKCRETE